MTSAVAQDDLTNLPPCSRPDGKYACQRLGCDAYYVPGSADNVDGCCVHHTEPPSFRDGVKSWPCCQKSSHDFGEFMSIRGCATGRHTCVKTEYAPAVKAETTVNVTPIPLSMEAQARGETDVGAATCARCRAGFYCAEHATPKSPSTSGVVEEQETQTEATRNDEASPTPVVDPDAIQTCKRPGCGEKFTERENADEACRFHAGQPIFHETKKGWSCCGTLVYDFDDFLKIPPCARGRHDANAAPLRFQKHTDKAAATS